MVFRFNPRPGSQRSTTDPPSYEVEYVAAGAFDLGTVKAYAANLTPPIVATAEGFLFRQEIGVAEQGFRLYYVTVTYGQKKQNTGSFKFSFSTTGGSFHIQASRQTVARYPGSAKDMGQLIGVHGDHVDGADIIIPALKLTYTFKHPQGVVNEAFAVNVARLTGCVNDDPFRGFAPGEVLFLGGDGSDGTDSEAEVSYSFAAEENLQSLVIGAISGIQKDGHDLLWVTWEDDNTGNKPGKKPKAVYVERVYRRISLSAALGF
jgi:hypothetical protein